MNNEKMDTSAVYTLFEELKEKITELGNGLVQTSQNNSPTNSNETTKFVEELYRFAVQKQFSPEQIKELQENMAQFSVELLVRMGKKVEKEMTEVINHANLIAEKIDSLNIPLKFVIHKKHIFTVDFKNSKAAITIIVMGLVSFLSLYGNLWQYNRNNELRDNDLKYRYVKIQGKITEKDIYKLETKFEHTDSIIVIRKQVEGYERLVKEQAEKMEKARWNAEEADKLQKEVESLKIKK
jgi:hypothetical protein